jgi:hypothetical protein
MKHYTINQKDLKHNRRRGERLADTAFRLIRSGIMQPGPSWASLHPWQYRIELNAVRDRDGDCMDSVRVLRPWPLGRNARIVSRGLYWAREESTQSWDQLGQSTHPG